MQPIVRHLIACQDIQPGSSPERFTLVQVITSIRSLEPVPFPLLYREICVVAICTECRGQGDIQIQIVDEESKKPSRETETWTVTFKNNPLQIVGIPFRIRPVRFPRAGVYLVQLLYNGVVVAQEPIRVSE